MPLKNSSLQKMKQTVDVSSREKSIFTLKKGVVRKSVEWSRGNFVALFKNVVSKKKKVLHMEKLRFSFKKIYCAYKSTGNKWYKTTY